jgi:hypothetical protein
MNEFLNTALKQLPTLITVVDRLTGLPIPPHLVDDVRTLIGYVHDTKENFMQNAPLTDEQRAKLTSDIETIPLKDEWQVKD